MKKAKKLVLALVLLSTVVMAAFVLSACPNETLQITEPPTKTEFLVGREIVRSQLEGGSMTHTVDGVADIHPTDAVGVRWQPNVFNTVGPATLTLGFGNAYASVPVTVRPIATNISVATMPTNTVFVEGQQPNFAGGTILITNQGHENETVSMTSDRFEVIMSSEGVTRSVQFRLRLQTDRVTTPFNVTFNYLAVDSIQNFVAPAKADYTVGQDLDMTGGSITVNLNNGTGHTIQLTNTQELNQFFVVSGFTRLAGTHIVRLAARHNETLYRTFPVTVTSAVPVSTISIYTEPTATSILLGQSLNLAGGVVRVLYPGQADIFEPMSNTTAFNVEYDSSTVNQAAVVRVSLVSNSSNFATFTRPVVQNTLTSITLISAPTKTDYFLHEEFDLSGGSVRFNYAGGASRVVQMSDPDIVLIGNPLFINPSAPFSVMHRNHLNIGGPTITFRIRANDAASVSIVEPITTNAFYQNEGWDLSGGIVRITYQNPVANPVTRDFDMGDRATFFGVYNTQGTFLTGGTPFILQSATQVSNRNQASTNNPFNTNPENTTQQRQTITIRPRDYRDLTTTFVVDVWVLESMNVSPPTATSISLAESINLMGGHAQLTYTHPILGQSLININMLTDDFAQRFTVTGHNPFPSSTQQQQITVTFDPVNAFNATFNVTVHVRPIIGLDFLESDMAKTIIIGFDQGLDLTGGKIRVRFADDGLGIPYIDLDMDSQLFNVTGFTPNTEGLHTITFGVDGLASTIQLQIYVFERALISYVGWAITRLSYRANGFEGYNADNLRPSLSPDHDASFATIFIRMLINSLDKIDSFGIFEEGFIHANSVYDIVRDLNAHLDAEVSVGTFQGNQI
ncbi:MAG: hypothetical protein FWD86_01070, partial [Firmicutes bacterium]|nr:hypothetical protein [Bacillota bacterium]